MTTNPMTLRTYAVPSAMHERHERVEWRVVRQVPLGLELEGLRPVVLHSHGAKRRDEDERFLETRTR